MSVESNEGDDVSAGSLACRHRPSWREAAHTLTAPSHNYVKDLRSKAPTMAQMSDMHSHFKISHAMWARLLNERVLHPRFVTLLRVGGLPPPGAAHSHFGIVYSRFLKFLFAMCIIVCTSRLFKRSRPAYYNVWTNMAFVMLHWWLPFAHHTVSNLIKLHQKESPAKKADAEDPEEEEQEEDVLNRSSLQQSLADLISDYNELLWHEYGEHGLAVHTPLSKEELALAKKMGRLREIDEYDQEFGAVRRMTGAVAYIGMVAVPVLSTLIYFGWMHYDFFSPVYVGSPTDEPDYESHAPTRLWYGVISGLAFAVVVVPWILALFAVYGMVNALSTCLAARTRLFQRSVERVHAATISALRHEYQASMHAMEEEAKSREQEHNEPPNENKTQIDVVYCDKVASESNSERPVGLELSSPEHGSSADLKPWCTRGRSRILSRDFGGSNDDNSGWVICHNGTRLHSLIGHTTFIPIDMRHHFKHDNTAYPMLRREAFIINHQIKLACTEFSYVLASLLFVCVALIAMPAYAMYIQFNLPVWQHDSTSWHYVLRDVFNVALGSLSIWLSLHETSKLTTACKKCCDTISELDLRGMAEPPWFPQLTAHQALVDYISSQAFQQDFGFHILGRKIEEADLIAFTYLIVSGFLFIVLDMV